MANKKKKFGIDAISSALSNSLPATDPIGGTDPGATAPSIDPSLANLTTTASTKAADPKYSSLGNMPAGPQVAQATTQAIQAGANPMILNKAKAALGSMDYTGLCERFVEMTQGVRGKFASAIDAWHKQADQAVSGLGGIKPGDAIYFAPDRTNSGYGHTGVYTGDGKMISATNNGVKEIPLSNWIKSTGQQVLGYIPKG